MSWFDIVIIVILAGFAWYGFFFGLIRVIGDLVGLIVGAYVAGKIYVPVFEFLDRFIPGSPGLGKVIIFILCFSIISRLVSWLVALLEQGFNLISIIPFLKTANRLLGLAFGIVEGILSLGIAAYILTKHLPAVFPLAQWLEKSELAPWLIKVSKILAPILPEIFGRFQSFI